MKRILILFLMAVCFTQCASYGIRTSKRIAQCKMLPATQKLGVALPRSSCLSSVAASSSRGEELAFKTPFKDTAIAVAIAKPAIYMIAACLGSFILFQVLMMVLPFLIPGSLLIALTQSIKDNFGRSAKKPRMIEGVDFQDAILLSEVQDAILMSSEDIVTKEYLSEIQDAILLSSEGSYLQESQEMSRSEHLSDTPSPPGSKMKRIKVRKNQMTQSKMKKRIYSNAPK